MKKFIRSFMLIQCCLMSCHILSAKERVVNHKIPPYTYDRLLFSEDSKSLLLFQSQPEDQSQDFKYVIYDISTEKFSSSGELPQVFHEAKKQWEFNRNYKFSWRRNYIWVPNRPFKVDQWDVGFVVTDQSPQLLRKEDGTYVELFHKLKKKVVFSKNIHTQKFVPVLVWLKDKDFPCAVFGHKDGEEEYVDLLDFASKTITTLGKFDHSPCVRIILSPNAENVACSTTDGVEFYRKDMEGNIFHCLRYLPDPEGFWEDDITMPFVTPDLYVHCITNIGRFTLFHGKWEIIFYDFRKNSIVYRRFFKKNIFNHLYELLLNVAISPDKRKIAVLWGEHLVIIHDPIFHVEE